MTDILIWCIIGCVAFCCGSDWRARSDRQEMRRMRDRHLARPTIHHSEAMRREYDRLMYGKGVEVPPDFWDHPWNEAEGKADAKIRN